MTVALSPKAFDTLGLLLRHRHRVLPKDELFREVWGDVRVSEDSLTQTISSLRRALGDDRSHAEYITTVPRRGYRFVAPVTNGESERLSAETIGTSAAVETVHAVQPSELHDPAGRRRWAWAVAFVAVVVAAVAVALVGRRPSTARQTPPDLQPIYFPLEIPRELTTMSGGLLSPTGDRVAFVAFDNDTATVRIWLRHLSAPEVRPLPGTEDA